MSRIYRVKGMHCAGCARSVGIAIRRHAPRAEVSVDLDRGLVTVGGEAAEAAVRDAVTEAGFEFAGTAPASI